MKPGVDYVGVACVFFCHDGQGNLLLHKRSHKSRDEKGRWDCGGGMLEVGEEIENTIKREVKEEFNAQVEEIQFLAHSNVMRDNDGEKTHWLALVFAVQIKPQGVKINEPEKIEELGWFRKDNLPSPRHSMWEKHFQYVVDAGIV
jgi:8-oxo-dGTP diphosphatase